MKNKTLIVVSAVIVLVLTAILINPSFFEKNTSVKNENAVQTSGADANKSDTEKKRNAGEVLCTGILNCDLYNYDEPMKELPRKKVSFVACGDNLIHSSVYTDASDLASGTEKEYNFVPMYENIADIIEEADLAFINQETPFGGDTRPISGYPQFNTPDQMGYDLSEIGFDIIGLANNHMLDCGSKGYKRTIDFWENMDGMIYVGGYKNKDDYDNIRIIESDGIKIAFLAYTYGTNGLSLPSGSELVLPLYNDSDIDRQTKLAREMADCVIVSIHWGAEDSFTPSSTQKKKAEIMINNGVDVILGHHPHVLQNLEWADRPDGGKTLVMYSLGNFLSGMMYSRNMVGGILGFDIVKAPNGTTVEDVSFIPTVSHYNKSVREFKIYRFSEYTEDLEKEHGAHKFDSAMSLKNMRKMIENEIPKEFLTEDFYNR